MCIRDRHTADPVPFVIYDSAAPANNSRRFTEKDAGETGLFIEEGHTLLGRLLSR